MLHSLALLATLAAPGREHGEPPADSLDRLMGPGVSQELAAYRAEQLRDVRYALRMMAGTPVLPSFGKRPPRFVRI